MIINFKNYKFIYAKIIRIKNPFIELEDYSGKIQIYCKLKFSIGDIVLIYGKIKKTKKKIFFINIFYIKLIVKNLKYIKNDNILIKKKFCIFNFLNNYLKKFMFIIANSSNFCKNKSNSLSNLFKTYSFCKKKFFYLKISPEFNIKKILSNNYNRIYDITKCYRNEGCSNIHNFEFNMLEYYSSNFNFKNSIFFLEKIIKNSFLSLNNLFFEIFNIKFNYNLFFKKISLIEILYIYFIKKNFFYNNKKFFFFYCYFIGIKFIKNFFLNDIFFKIFNEKIQKKIIFPLFLLFFPRKNSFLTKINTINIKFSKRFELFILGIEISNGFEELNDYFIQKKNLKKKNKDFLIRLKNCLYNTNGVGIGIDRLFMIILKNKHIINIL
ncbi:amino acid--tRNA ligase-related protein [Candidatus Carsonella ruddii]|uniref:amino acid--tRNA ligase-related protein n=1 Tax=Carsonella ruddii TaxID=114186 RepID=UPI003D383242